MKNEHFDFLNYEGKKEDTDKNFIKWLKGEKNEKPC